MAAQSPCAVHAALTMKMGPRACARVSYRPLVIDGNRALHKKRLDVVGVEHDLLELLDRVPPRRVQERHRAESGAAPLHALGLRASAKTSTLLTDTA
mgnify:CR=1 FL=1